MKRSLGRQLEREKRKIDERLAPLMGGNEPKEPGVPEFNAPEAKYEMTERFRAAPCGGLAAMHDLVRSVRLPGAIDERLGILKRAARTRTPTTSSTSPTTRCERLSGPSLDAYPNQAMLGP